MKIFLNIFSKELTEDELNNLQNYNKTKIIDRKSFKNFIISCEKNNHLLFKIIFQYLRLVVEKYEKRYNPKDEVKNYLIVEPIILEVFHNDIIKMFKDKDYLIGLSIK